MRNSSVGVWTYLAVGAGKQLLQIGDTKVGNANVADLPGTEQLLHLPPRILKVPVLIRLLAVIGIDRDGPVHQEKVKVVSLQVIKTGR